MITETDSSNWITESQVTVSRQSTEETQPNKSEGSLTDIKSLTGTYTLASESDDNLVVTVPPVQSVHELTSETESDKPSTEMVMKKREDRTRANIPNTTASKPYLRSHSGSWKTHRKKRPTKNEKITVSLPVDQPFQPNLKHSMKRESNNNSKELDNKSSVELPKLKDDSNGRISAPESPTDVLTSAIQSTVKPTSTTRI